MRKRKRSRESRLLRKWNLPDVDARGYLRGAFASAAADAEVVPEPGPDNEDDPWHKLRDRGELEDTEEDDFYGKQQLPGGHFRGYERGPFDLLGGKRYLPANPDGGFIGDRDEDGYAAVVQDFFEDVAVARELLREAEEALRSGDADRILELLDSDLLRAVGKDVLDAAENWSRQLVHPQDVARPGAAIRQQVITAVNDLCVKLCRLIAESGTALNHIEWRHLELVIATALEGIGFEVEITPPSKDGGKDLVASCLMKGHKFTYYVEVKHWRSGKRVNSRTVFDFVEVNVEDRTHGGLLVSTSGFCAGVANQLSEMSRHNVRLGDKQKVISLCQHFVRNGRGIWTTRQSLPEILFEQTVTPNRCQSPS